MRHERIREALFRGSGQQDRSSNVTMRSNRKTRENRVIFAVGCFSSLLMPSIARPTKNVAQEVRAPRSASDWDILSNSFDYPRLICNREYQKSCPSVPGTSAPYLNFAGAWQGYFRDYPAG